MPHSTNHNPRRKKKRSLFSLHFLRRSLQLESVRRLYHRWSHAVLSSTCFPSPFSSSADFTRPAPLSQMTLCSVSPIDFACTFYMSHCPDDRPVHYECDNVEFARIASKSIMFLMTRTRLMPVNQDLKTLHQVACEYFLTFFNIFMILVTSAPS